MQAIVHRRYGGPGVLEVADLAPPDLDADGVLVRVRASSLNAGDWHAMWGRPYVMRAGSGLRRPKAGRLGVDLAGVVEAVGANVSRLQPGDEVYGMVPNGAFAEQIAGGVWIVPKPRALTFEDAASVPAAGCTALQAVRDHGRVEAGQRVLVHGAGGGVGTFAVQIAKAFGAEVTAATTAAKVELVRSLGAEDVVDHARDDVIGGHHRFDVIVDVGARRSIGDLRRGLAPDGLLVLVGAGRGPTGPLGRFAATALRSRIARQRVVAFVAGGAFEENLQVMTDLVEAGRVRPVVDRIFSLAEAGDAMRYFASGPAGKVVLRIP